MPRIIYSPRYNIRACGIEKLHPFDSCKYGRAMRRIREQLGPRLNGITVAPRRPISRRDLLDVHSAAYLDRLRSPAYLAAALEVPQVAQLPAGFVHYTVLRPMRWACAGTILAGELALAHKFAINLSGGYHHAKPDAGEGFCIYNDIALLVHRLRASGRIAHGAQIAYVDLDVHQGNGVCHAFLHDRRVAVFDMYNRMTYPAYDLEARERIDHAVPVDFGCSTREYLELLRTHLPAFLEEIAGVGEVAVIIYNAGTDILTGDPLGGLAVSREGILARDAFVIDQALQREVPCVMLLSGGYTQESHAIIGDSVLQLANRFI
jgi:histone deacetylase 11